MDDEDAPFTLAKETGVGAFQFSTAEYRGGKQPVITLEDLDAMRHSFALGRSLSAAFEEIALEGEMMISVGSYRDDQSYLRVWHCSDGANVLFATYVSNWDLRNDEPEECDAFVSRFAFLK